MFTRIPMLIGCRPAAVENTLRRLRSWRSICPEIVVRSTFVVGFPGETNAAFGNLLDFLEEAQLDRVGCFAYSDVEGAAANLLPGHVEPAEKLDRQERLMEVQSDISQAKLAAKRGQQLEVLVDSVSGTRAEARSWGDAPEIDGVVHLEDARDLRAGDRVLAEITDSDVHDLYGRNLGQPINLD